MSGPVFNSKSTTFQDVCLLGHFKKEVNKRREQIQNKHTYMHTHVDLSNLQGTHKRWWYYLININEKMFPQHTPAVKYFRIEVNLVEHLLFKKDFLNYPY